MSYATMTRWTPMAALAVVLLGGCGARYRVPGRAADFHALGITAETVEQSTDRAIARRLDRRPLAGFPTSIAVVRTQGPGYRSHTTRSWGSGRYTIVTIRDVETEEQLVRISDLPMVAGIAPLNRLVLPRHFNSDMELRQGAATVQADMVLVYTFDTAFNVEKKIPPLGILTLGLFPHEEARVVCTASGVLMDTRNGYVYGLLEATSTRNQPANAWTSAVAVDHARRQAEADAFDQLVDAFVKLWPGVVERYGPGTDEENS